MTSGSPTPRLTYKLVGYDRKTERQGKKHVLPPGMTQGILDSLGIDPTTPEGLADHQLRPRQAVEIAEQMGIEIDVDRFDYFLEPYPEKVRLRQETEA